MKNIPNVLMLRLLCVTIVIYSLSQCEKHNVMDIIETRKYPANPLENNGSAHQLSPHIVSPHSTAAVRRVRRVRRSSNDSISRLPVVKTSPTSGYVTSGACSKLMTGTCEKDVSYTVWVYRGQVALISFPLFALQWAWYSENKGYVRLMTVHRGSSFTTVWRYQTPQTILPELYNSTLIIQLFIPPKESLLRGFKMIFSIHPVSETPPRVRQGVFNCSVPFYPSFQAHFHCNLVPECPGGEDEGPHCNFSSEACQGDVAVANKCYHHHRTTQTLRWTQARAVCQRQGGDLATMRTLQEWDAFLLLLSTLNLLDPVYVGMYSFHPSMPNIYRKSYVWVDGVVNYRYGTRPRGVHTFYDRVCLYYDSTISFRFKYWLNYLSCETTSLFDFVCQTEVRNVTSTARVSLPHVYSNFTMMNSNLSLKQCPGHHLTHSFLLCDPSSHCGADSYVSQCSTSGGLAGEDDMINFFVCNDAAMTVPYSLVCDFRNDCSDGSDETLCSYADFCLDFRCRNGQCLLKSQHCNVAKDCWDGSDEACTHIVSLFNITFRVPPPSMINFDSSGNVTYSTISNCERSCPETHFCCPEGYCLPVYSRCNGLGDCEGKEDEADCETSQCPGLYRCRAAQVCVHAQHLCDGWPQCPQHDDEWLCGMQCPAPCFCQGLAFRCPLPAPHASFPTLLRYLDAGGSGMGPDNVTGLEYLVWLSLARCELTQVTEMNLPNLWTLDLSLNQLASLTMDVFLSLLSLRHLDLSRNPLEHVFSASQQVQNVRLLSVNLSNVLLTTFNGTVLGNYPRVRVLDLSHSSLTGISVEGFHSLPNLAHVDLRGCKILEYPSDVFRHLNKLQTVQADEYKLCCKEFLPPGFDRGKCSAPVDEISSCDDLLRSDTYRAFLWLFSVLSLIGNLGCLVARLFLLKSKSSTTFSVFVTNLGIADLLMGVYLAMVGAADHMYRGQYVWFEKTWKPSIPCRLAGFLSLLSSETSAFIICLITLDRFLVLSSPFSDLRFRRFSARVACVLAWLLGLCLAAVPLLPATAEWQFYSQTGICIPLPITRRTFKGRDYAFGVIILFNLALFLLIATGQAMIYWTIRTTSMSQSSTKKTEDMTVARRLVSVVVSDFLCWFPIGLLGVLAASGTPVPGEVNVGMAIFVLPLNAALNPFLYTFNALMDRLRRREEEQLLKQLEARAAASLYGEPGA